MKLQDLDVIVTAPPAPGWGGRYWILVKVTTDTGITGWGECYASSVGPEAMTHVIRDVFQRHMAGENPENIELMFRRAYSSGFTQRPDLTVMGAFSGLEIACWDILGKDRGRPVHALIGGRMNGRIRAYTYLYPLPHQDIMAFWTSPEMAAEAALKRVEEGYTALKFDPAGPYTIYDGHQPRLEDLERSEMFVKRIREAVGTRADLLFGTHGQFTVSGAKRMARRLEPYEPLWFEEPTTPENPADMAEVARFTSVPIATGERLCTKHEFARVLEAGAASILQMDLGRVGGLLEAKKIASMAETRQAQIAPHLYCGPVVAAANIQIATCSPNFLILESIGTFEGPYMSCLKSSITWEEGYVIPSSEPGLGVELDDEAIAASPYTGTELHLELAQEPVVQ